MAMLSLDEAILSLRSDPSQAELVREAYLGEDVMDCGRRFLEGPEFAETLRLLGGAQKGAVVLDIGAGRGIASYAFAKSGAKRVIALEPDKSELVGQGSLLKLCQGLPVELIEGVGEKMDLPEASVDIAYARQVLHHIPDLPAALGLVARVLKPGGIFFAAREHVADNAAELAEFLAGHPVHRLAGGEHAWPLKAYRGAIQGAGLEIIGQWGPWDSLVNAVPDAKTQAELEALPGLALRRRLGAALGGALYALPPLKALVRALKNRAQGGRLYSFMARKRP